MNEENYKFQSNKQVLKALFIDGGEYFSPFFDSYEKSKKNFFFQVVNLVLLFILTNVLLDGLLDTVTDNIRGSGVLTIKIILLVLIALITSAFKENKVMRWQLLFETGYKLTKKWLVFIFCTTLGGIYLKSNK